MFPHLDFQQVMWILSSLVRKQRENKYKLTGLAWGGGGGGGGGGVGGEAVENSQSDGGAL